MESLQEICFVVNAAIDTVFSEEKYNLKFFEYLKAGNYKRKIVIDFINSNLHRDILNQIEEFDSYLEGEDSSFFKEAYSWMGKPRARRIKNYLNTIIEDAKRYEQSKKPGRKPKITNK